MKGIGRLAFAAEIAADPEVGWPIKAVYQKRADDLSIILVNGFQKRPPVAHPSELRVPFRRDLRRRGPGPGCIRDWVCCGCLDDTIARTEGAKPFWTDYGPGRHTCSPRT